MAQKTIQEAFNDIYAQLPVTNLATIGNTLVYSQSGTFTTAVFSGSFSPKTITVTLPTPELDTNYMVDLKSTDSWLNFMVTTKTLTNFIVSYITIDNSGSNSASTVTYDIYRRLNASAGVPFLKYQPTKEIFTASNCKMLRYGETVYIRMTAFSPWGNGATLTVTLPSLKWAPAFSINATDYGDGLWCIAGSNNFEGAPNPLAWAVRGEPDSTSLVFVARQNWSTSGTYVYAGGSYPCNGDWV